jgi:hypothetical protein
MNPAFAIILVLLIGAVTAFCVFVESGQRRDPGELREDGQVGRRMYAGQTQPPAVQAQHVGRDPPDLRLVAAAVPGDARELLRRGPDRNVGCRRSLRRSAGASRFTS